MGVTDCHVHINPAWEMLPRARALIQPSESQRELEEFLTHPDRFLEYLDRSGVDRAVLVNYISPEVIGYTERTNEFVSEYAKADLSRLIAIGSVLPSHPHPAAEVDRLIDSLGIRGLKIHPSHQLFAPNDYVGDRLPGLRSIYATAERRRVPVIFHTGTSVFPGARNRFAEPMLVEDVAIDFPELTIVLAHGGRPFWTAPAMFLARRFPNVFLELSSIPPSRVTEYFPGIERLKEKLLFGTDWPGPGVKDIGANVAAFRALPLPKELVERALVTNPERVFPRRPPS